MQVCKVNNNKQQTRTKYKPNKYACNQGEPKQLPQTNRRTQWHGIIDRGKPTPVHPPVHPPVHFPRRWTPPPLQTIIGDSYKTPLMYLRKDSSPVKKIYQYINIYIISILLEVLSLPKYPPIIVIYWIHVGRRLNGVFLSEPLEITYWHK